MERIKLLEELSENVVSIPYYDFDRTKNCKDIKINGRHYYWVLDCEYDSKLDLRLIERFKIMLHSGKERMLWRRILQGLWYTTMRCAKKIVVLLPQYKYGTE